MENEIFKIKQSVFKIMIISIIFFLISAVAFLFLMITPFILLTEERFIHISIEITFGVIFAILMLITLLAIIGGIIFLSKNKKIIEVNRIKCRWALEMGIFYFRVVDCIMKLIDQQIETNKKVKLLKDDNIDITDNNDTELV